jgi:predicted acylesterase/phospholipase RssA
MAIGLVLGGGAPNLPLMTGALFALDKAGVDFKVITTTGAGMVVGLLYAAPRENETHNTWEKARRKALQDTRDWGIDDLIYHFVPVNYKIFQKPGMLAQAYSHATNPYLWSIPRETRRQRLLGDTLALMASAMSPSDLKASSAGLCQPPPWIELLVDFEKLKKNLKKGDKKFRLSAYCIEDESEKTFHKEEISAEHFKAALAMPFIYEPYKLKVEGADGEWEWKTYLEGSAFKTLQLDPEDVMSENHIDTVIFFDIMGNRNLIGEPRWLIDAWGKSIVAPLTRLAELGLEDFKLRRDEHKKEREIRELDALMDLAESDPDQFKLRRDLYRKRREFRELKDIARLVLNTSRDAELFTEKFDAYIARYLAKGRANDKARFKKAQTVDDKKKLIGARLDVLTGAIEKLTPKIKPLKSGRDPMVGSVQKGAGGHDLDRTELLRMPFRDHIPDDQWPEVLDWSHSNMQKLFDIGVETGEKFYEDHKERLKLSMKYKADPA